MDARPYWNRYTEANGGPVGVAAKLGIPYSTIAGICNGSRGIGRDLATRMAEADPELDAKILIWVAPVKEGSSGRDDPNPDASRIIPPIEAA